MSERIVKKPGTCGGRAIVHGTRIPVWGLAKAWMDGGTDYTVSRMYPQLSEDDIDAARAYWNAHPIQIATDIVENW